MQAAGQPVLFVCHHSSQIGVAVALEQELLARGVRCWIAPRDIFPGETFDRAIHQAIEDADALLLLFCPKAERSRHVKREIILADQLGKPIIPMRLEKIKAGDLSYHLADAQWVNWMDRSPDAIDRVAAKAHQVRRGGEEQVEPPVEALSAEELLGEPGGEPTTLAGGALSASREAAAEAVPDLRNAPSLIEAEADLYGSPAIPPAHPEPPVAEAAQQGQAWAPRARRRPDAGVAWPGTPPKKRTGFYVGLGAGAAAAVIGIAVLMLWTAPPPAAAPAPAPGTAAAKPPVAAPAPAPAREDANAAVVSFSASDDQPVDGPE